MRSKYRAISAVNALVGDEARACDDAVLVDTAIRAMLVYIEELEDRVSTIEHKPDPFAVYG